MKTRPPHPLAVCLGIFLAFATAVRANEEISPQARAAIEKGLAYLAAAQRPDGSWSGGNYNDSTAIAAGCALAFMGAGHLPGQGTYGRNTARAIDFIVRNAQPDGLLYIEGTSGMVMYHHSLAALALAEAWGSTRDPELREVLLKAVRLIITSQNPEGGWRYQPRPGGADISVTVTQLMALRAALDAGIHVPQHVIDAGIRYVKSCHNDMSKGGDGGFGYGGPGISSFGRSGAGLTSLQVAGDYRAKEVFEATQYLLKYAPYGARPVDAYYYYGHYYVAQGINQTRRLGAWGEEAWAAYYPPIVQELLGKQLPNGSWPPSYGHLSTAFSLLVLQIPHRYLPIYQH